MKDKYNKIEKYLDGELNAEEHAAFEKEMDRDEALTEQVRWWGKTQQMAKRGLLEERAEREFLDLVRQTEKKHFRARVLPLRRVMAIAASAAVVALALFFWWPREQPSPQALYEQYADLNTIPFGNLGDMQDTLQQIDAAFRGRNYQDAETLLQAYLEGKSFDNAVQVEALFKLGVARLQLDDTEGALAAFRSYREIGQYGKAAWYLALTHLKRGEIEDCRNLLETLQETNTPVAGQARELLEKL